MSYTCSQFRKTLWYVPSDKLGGTKGSQGDSFFQTPNPDFGAMMTYFVRDELKTKKAIRKGKEAKIAKSGGDVPVPSWDELRAEELEVAPKIYFEFTDQSGNIVARMNGSTAKGLHRVNWNLRYTEYGFGPMVAPGNYTAQAFKSVAGEVTKLGEPRTFEVVSIVEPSIEAQDIEETIQYQLDLAKFRDSIGAASQSLQTTIERMGDIKSAISRSPHGSADLMKTAEELELSLKSADRSLNGDEIISSKFQQDVPSIGSRVSSVLFGTMRSTHGITKTQRDQVDIAKQEFVEVSEKIKRLLQDDVKAFQRQLGAAGIPWTEGREIPDFE